MNESNDERLRQAGILHGQGRRQEAIDIFRQVLAEHPGASEGWYELGYLLKAEGQFEEALTAYGKALELGISRPEEVHLNRAVIYSDHLRRDVDAELELAAALTLAPAYVPALLNRGNLHEERGEQAEALACYDSVLSGDGGSGDPHRDLRFEALARSAKLRPPKDIDDPLFRRLQDATAAPSGNVVRANLLFALGQAHEKLEQFDLAFDAFAKANRWLRRQYGRSYDRDHMSRLVDSLIQAFPSSGNSEAIATGAPDTPGAEPLFICGMFRSGSTLVEQVLAAHPQVTAGGELNWLRHLAASRLAPFPESMALSDPARDAALAGEYLAHLANLFSDGIAGTYITDKRPDNFLLIGLIKRLFPTAKIIHTCRDPLDIGLSVFQQHLDLHVAGYASDLGDIGHYYGQYRRLMAHWHSLYPDSIFDFHYDTFVRSPRPSLEPLLGFLGLDWNDRCLEFHQLGNTVKTASYWQIRQPLSTRSSGRWRNYGAHLAPLRQTLQEAGVATTQA
ncbi:MAG: tetratricopeptide repeat-containing sulfotransferase family protein [Thermomonas sp.]